MFLVIGHKEKRFTFVEDPSVLVEDDVVARGVEALPG